MELLLIIGGLFVLVIVGVIISAAAQSERDSGLKGKLQAAGFNPTAMYTSLENKKGVAIDTDGRKIAIMNNDVPRIFKYDDLLAVEVVRNGHSVMKTEVGNQVARAAAGAVLLGPIGLLIGGLTGNKKSVEMIRKLSLKVYTTSNVTPVEDLVFMNIGGSGVQAGNMTEFYMKQLDEWHDRLKMAMLLKTS